MKLDRSCLKLLLPSACFLYVVLWCVLHLEEGLKSSNVDISAHNTKNSNNQIHLQNRQRDDEKFENNNNNNNNKKIVLEERKRTAVVVYLPKDINFVNQFVTMLYGSWRYIYDNQFTIFSNGQENLNLVDLVVFAKIEVLKRLPRDCTMFYENRHVVISNSMNCFKVEQKYETLSLYKNLNSYIMFLRHDIDRILHGYTYILRTDMDVFLTPKFFTYRPTLRVVTGVGQYCHEFNRGRLKAIAKRHGLKHRGVHCVGSSWYGFTKDITKLSKDAYNMSLYLYDREFRDGLPGLEHIDFHTNPNGKWPDWYKLTSTMYGSEIVLNDGVPNFSMENFQRFDVSTCNPWQISEQYQLHAYHTECEFNKKRFMNIITEYATGTSRRRKWIEDKLNRHGKMLAGSGGVSIQDMNATAYSTFIAWRSAAKYLEFRLKI